MDRGSLRHAHFGPAVLARSCAPALLVAQGETPTGDVIATVKSESGAQLAASKTDPADDHTNLWR